MSQAEFEPDEGYASSFELQSEAEGSPECNSGPGQGLANLVGDSKAAKNVLATLRAARGQFPGKTIEDRVVVEYLVRSMFGEAFDAALGDLNDKVVEMVADTLMDDPPAMQRLKSLWEQSVGVER